MRPTTPRERRLVAVGLLIAAIALAYLAVVAPIAHGFAARAAARQALLLEYQHNVRTIAAVPRLRRQAERQRAVLDRFVLEAPDLAAATQRLRERAERVVTEAGGEFQAGEDADAPAGWIAVRASARVTEGQLARVLARLQNDAPWLVVTGLDISADQALADGQSHPMETSFEIAIPLRSAKPR